MGYSQGRMAGARPASSEERAVKRLVLKGGLLAALLAALPVRAIEADNASDAARRLVAALEAAWNRHDMQVYGALFHEDAEWVNVVGMYWRGKAQVMKAHTVFHETIFKEVQLEGRELSVRELSPDVAVAVWTHLQDAYRTPSGNLQEKTLNRMTVVVSRRQGQWLISQGQNVWINERAEKSNPVHQR